MGTIVLSTIPELVEQRDYYLDQDQALRAYVNAREDQTTFDAVVDVIEAGRELEQQIETLRGVVKTLLEKVEGKAIVV